MQTACEKVHMRITCRTSLTLTKTCWLNMHDVSRVVI